MTQSSLSLNSELEPCSRSRYSRVYAGPLDEGFPKRARWLHSRQRRLYRSRFTTPWVRHLWLFSRVCLLVLAIVLSVQNVLVELSLQRVLSMRGESPQVIYNGLVYLGEQWPFDRNVRQAAAKWRILFESYSHK